MTPRLNFRPVLMAFVAMLFLAALCAAAAPPKPLSVDYVIGMLESGLDQKAIVGRIVDGKLTFRLSEGDLDRLRAAGAGEDLVKAVTREGVVLENRASSPAQAPAPRTEATGQEGAASKPGAPPPDGWSRPQRMGAQPAPEAEGPRGGITTLEEGEEEEEQEGYDQGSGEDDWMTPRYGMTYYAPGYAPDYYPWAYWYGYYGPYASFYYYPHYYYYPYWTTGHPGTFFHGHGGGFRGTPRGSPGGHSGVRGGGAPRTAPRGARPPRGH